MASPAPTPAPRADAPSNAKAGAQGNKRRSLAKTFEAVLELPQDSPESASVPVPSTPTEPALGSFARFGAASWPSDASGASSAGTSTPAPSASLGEGEEPLLPCGMTADELAELQLECGLARAAAALGEAEDAGGAARPAAA